MPVPTIPLVANAIIPPAEEYGEVNVNASPVADEQDLLLDLKVPVVTVVHNVQGEFPLQLELKNPTPTNTIIADRLELNLTLHSPTVQIDGAPVADVFPLTATLQTSTLTIDSQFFVPFVFALTISGPNTIAPGIGSLTVQVRKFINDPVTTGGCAQCGTFLWDSHPNAIPIDSDRVHGGLNFDIHSGQPFQPGAGGSSGPDDMYIRCARCGWINNMTVASSQPEGSKAGWGISFPEFEVIPNEPADEWGTQIQPSQPGIIDNSTP